MAKYSISSKIFATIFILPFLLIGIVLILQCIDIPKKLSQTNQYEVTIQDNANILGDTTNLKQSLQKFYYETGIAPSIITVNNESWKYNYRTLENYAYDLYVNNFDDEEHWLIVYSEPVNPNPTFNDWYWEGMQGDDTDSILTIKKTDKFNENLQKYLTASSKYSVCLAIQQAFDDMTSTVMKAEIEVIGLPFMIIWNSIVLICLVAIWVADKNGYDHIKYKDIRNAVQCNSTRLEEQCEYCSGIYIEGTCISCPHCGAPISKQKNTETNPIKMK